ncbi:MAG: nucleotidyltransferase domain-containing protein [Methanobacteriaceae archaeon]|nr:nucleotidyltransferase domain-containing protein [Methanobacteriaceae archaeon]
MIDVEKVEAILGKLQHLMEKDQDILAVIIYGSYARGEEARDVDLCLVLFPDKVGKGLDKRIEYSYYDVVDVQVFQDLPIYIRPRIIREGKVIHVKDEDMLYDVAIETSKEYELYRPKYELYLDSVAK